MTEPKIHEQTNELQFSHANTGLLYTTDDVPKWIEEWCQWARRLLVPEWSIYVAVSDFPNPNNPQALAVTECRHEYLQAEVIFRRSIEDNEDGWIAVIHEFLHIVLANLNASAYNIALFANAALKRSQGEKEEFDPLVEIVNDNYHDSEETVVVRLSRVLVSLRLASKEKNDGTSEATKSLGDAESSERSATAIRTDAGRTEGS
jgi:hypothetical protein